MSGKDGGRQKWGRSGRREWRGGRGGWEVVREEGGCSVEGEREGGCERKEIRGEGWEKKREGGSRMEGLSQARET